MSNAEVGALITRIEGELPEVNEKIPAKTINDDNREEDIRGGGK